MAALRSAEEKLLAVVKSRLRGRYIDIGNSVGNKKCKIWTLSLNEASKCLPLVMLHGFASGVGLWCMNFDAFASTRPVHAFDILGFGRSSRPSFSSDALEAEGQMVQSIEDWRKAMGLEEFILMGHSMGGFLAASYAIRFPDRVKHLILADPWGFPEKPINQEKFNIPTWVRVIATVLQPFNPLWGVRAAGPLGPKLVAKIRPDLIKKFSSIIPNSDEVIPNYIYHCNAQTPSGESAFHAMMAQFGWAKYPMINRIDSLNKEIPITLIYGSRSWVDQTPGNEIKAKRPDSYVEIQAINGAGHHVYADRPENFNHLVNIACDSTEHGSLFTTN
ncbi:unnamed protein product [Darwinula stevensoni]|uniref:1-acylglycerol-3-phosphate O-acyltransferase ABHD5 n=1 Tax=Darwinula stevensoni TaxID=69355 RepID=A0A7R8XA93_9CRUS|nr:unnamed protein product [Darwinula stevensoni]CAG0889780.1 unnamed protein product [Darwinula stevensoni]